ncbi:hypothetical protein LEP1GSC076_3045 [Leptospira sp. Fiocruz LV4135]|nr:hypothetical protein LEP1GSC076_3045 [Leptospira sp. Fiocruz LV4135]
MVRIAKIVFFEKSELRPPILKESFSQTAISHSKKERNFLADPKIRVF